MQKLIALLRGINMTGHNKIKMTDLSSLFTGLGFTEVQTYIQSGNVVFVNRGKMQNHDIALLIEEAIHEKFGYDVPAMVRTGAEVSSVISSNPFCNEENFDPEKLAVIFLHERPTAEQVEKVRDADYPPDKFRIIGREIFIYCPNGFGRTRLYTNFFENRMKVKGTARNWKTINALLLLLNEPGN